MVERNARRNCRTLLSLAMAVVATGCMAPTGRVGDLRAIGTTTRPAIKPVFVFDPASAGQDPYLHGLREEFQIDQVVAGATDDLDRLRRLCSWTSRQWKHSGWGEPKQSDPVSILREVRQGKRFRCVEYAIVLAGVCQSAGLPARVVGLMTEDVETRPSGAGHVVAEVYLPDRQKWVMADGQWNAIPMHGQTPLSVVEFEDLLGHAEAGDLWALDHTKRWTNGVYFPWVRPYLFYVKVPLDTRVNPSNEGYVILVPPGTPPPRVFQRSYPINNSLYTSFPADLYPHDGPLAFVPGVPTR